MQVGKPQSTSVQYQVYMHWITYINTCELLHPLTTFKPNTHRRRDETRQFRLVGVGGVYWALHTLT